MDDKDRINKAATSDVEGDPEREFDISGNVREKGQDPSPDDRDRGERSEAEFPGPGDAGRR